MRKLRHGELRSFAQDHTVIKSWSRKPNADLEQSSCSETLHYVWPAISHSVNFLGLAFGALAAPLPLP